MIVPLLRIEGVILIMLALIHIPFPRYFKWREETESCSLLTRQILHIHCFFIALGVLMMGVLCATSAPDLVGTSFGRKICALLAIFWFCRLIVQFFGYSPELWRGKRFETSMHVLFGALWIALTATFAWAAWV